MKAFKTTKTGEKTLRGGGDKREYGSGQLTLQHRQNSKQTVFQFCWNTCSVWQRAHRQRHTLPLSKHVRQTRQTARKEQREAALSKKAVTLPLPWSSVKDARLCSHNMPTCTSAATTAAHHLGHLVSKYVRVGVWQRQMCVLPVSASFPHHLFLWRWLFCWCTFSVYS